jgi:hypothetical protein
MTRMANEYERADHDRDLRKHEDRPSDKLPPLPLHVQSPSIAGALEVAVYVKGMKDPREAAKLVEQYAQTLAAAIPLDRRFALAKMVGYCEGVAKSGILSADGELQLRAVIAEVLAAFQMPSKVEREAIDAQA